jgi:hypothetical protein
MPVLVLVIVLVILANVEKTVGPQAVGLVNLEIQTDRSHNNSIFIAAP